MVLQFLLEAQMMSMMCHIVACGIVLLSGYQITFKAYFIFNFDILTRSSVTGRNQQQNQIWTHSLAITQVKLSIGKLAEINEIKDETDISFVICTSMVSKPP